jgi:cell wall-associated NlpC family hydrolase
MAKGTIKTAKKSVKTAEKSAKAAVKTARQTAKAAQKSARQTAKAAKTAERTARAAAKLAVQTAKAATRAAAATVKAAVAAVKGLATAIAAGGWIAVLVILIICLIGLLAGSVFGIFFSSEPSAEGGKTVNNVIAEIDDEYTAQIDAIVSGNAHDLLDMSGARAAWKQVLAVYTVRTVSDPDNPMEVAIIDDAKAAILRSVFWEMNAISHAVDAVEVEEDVLDEDGEPTGAATIVAKTVLRITVAHKTAEEMAAGYGFSADRRGQLEELLKPDYHGLWNGLLYGITSVGDGSMISAAETQLGNIGGEPYWSWYGFASRAEWCACFVSWCAEQCGFIDAGVLPRFSSCEAGIWWFKDRDQWQERGYTPAPGEIIFFDWDIDGISDHVGIVERADAATIYTIEGNTSDSVARRSYAADSVKVMGYGIPLYSTAAE